MTLDLHNLMALLDAFEPTICGSDESVSIFSVALLSPLSPPQHRETAHIAACPADLALLPHGHCAICCFGREGMGTDIACLGLELIFLAAQPNAQQVYAILSDAVRECNLQAQFAQDLLDTLYHSSSVQGVVDIAYRYMNNTITVFDAGFQLLACALSPTVVDPLASRLLVEPHLTEDDISKMNFEHVHERVKKSPVPILIRNKKFDNDRIISMISSQRDIGHFVIVEDNHPFRPLDYKLATLLRDALAQQLMKDEFTRNVQGFNYEYFLKDLLDERFAMSSGYHDRLGYLDQKFSAPVYCMVVETARTPGALSTNLIRNGFEALGQTISTIVYQGQIIVVSGGQPWAQQPEALALLRNYCTGNHLYCGMSNGFDSVLSLRGYYNQALRAIEIGAGVDGSPGLFVYQDYYMRHLSSIFLQKEQAEFFCCPQMKTLMEHDQKHGKALAETLFMYLLHGSTAATAAAMFIHRNTLLYRLNLIHQLVQIDDNPMLRQYLILSYEMMRHH